jgi:hypothetical protein
LFSSREVTSRVTSRQAIRYPILATKKSKGQTRPRSYYDSTSLAILHSRHQLGLVEVLLRCGWHLNLKFVDLVQEVGNLLLPLIELGVLHLNDVLQVHDRVSPSGHLLSGQL